MSVCVVSQGGLSGRLPGCGHSPAAPSFQTVLCSDLAASRQIWGVQDVCSEVSPADFGARCSVQSARVSDKCERLL